MENGSVVVSCPELVSHKITLVSVILLVDTCVCTGRHSTKLAIIRIHLISNKHGGNNNYCIIKNAPNIIIEN